MKTSCLRRPMRRAEAREGERYSALGLRSRGRRAVAALTATAIVAAGGLLAMAGTCRRGPWPGEHAGSRGRSAVPSGHAYGERIALRTCEPQRTDHRQDPADQAAHVRAEARRRHAAAHGRCTFRRRHGESSRRRGGDPAGGLPPGWPYQYNKDAWLPAVEKMVNDTKAAGKTNIVAYAIWNEPDITWRTANGSFFDCGRTHIG